LMFFIGAVHYSELETLLYEITDISVKMNEEEFAQLIQGDQRFRINGKNGIILSQPEVKDPDQLINEFENRMIDYADFEIDDLVDNKEVWAELYFDRPELEAIVRLRECTGKSWSIEELHLLINNEEVSPANLVNKLIGENTVFDSVDEFKEIAGIVMNLWNNWPRWELGGNTPNEIAEVGTRIGQPLRVVKTGRNDPCPGGSGKKYKKCCGADK